MNKHMDIGVRSLYSAVCVILFGLGFMANTQSAASFITEANYTSMIQATSIIFISLSGLYIFKHLHLYSLGSAKSWLKTLGLSTLVLFLIAWTDVLTVFTASQSAIN